MYMTIDPGMNTGYAIWEDAGNIILWGEFKIKKQINLALDIHELASRLGNVLVSHNVRFIHLEYPEVWAGSSLSAASAFSGDLLKLTCIVGAYAGFAYAQGIGIGFLTARQWKGQLSKEAVRFRVERALKFSTESTHTNDALGIGLFIQGRLVEPSSTERPFTK